MKTKNRSFPRLLKSSPASFSPNFYYGNNSLADITYIIPKWDFNNLLYPLPRLALIFIFYKPRSRRRAGNKKETFSSLRR